MCGLAMLVRPEMVLLGPIALALTAAGGGSGPRKHWAAGFMTGPVVLAGGLWLATGLAWALFARHHFGTFVPVTVVAKAQDHPWLVNAMVSVKRLAGCSHYAKPQRARWVN